MKYRIKQIGWKNLCKFQPSTQIVRYSIDTYSSTPYFFLNFPEGFTDYSVALGLGHFESKMKCQFP